MIKRYYATVYRAVMTSPNIKVNTFLKPVCKKAFVDCISKFFIGLEGVLGSNRLPLIFNKMRRTVTTIATIYSLAFQAALLYLTFISPASNYVPMLLSVIEYMFCGLFSFFTWKRTERYYSELNKFDTEIGCRPLVAAVSLRNFCVMLFFIILASAFHVVSNYYELFPTLCMTILPFNLIHCLELYYYGHLLSLIIPRLRLINYYVESALSTGQNVARPKVEEFTSFKHKHSNNTDMDKLMDMYHIAIKAYDYLTDAIKWQLLVILITSFGITLNFCYHVSMSIIRNENPFIDIVSDLGMMSAEMLPLFSPCMFGDQVHNEVRRLRELIASRLYENKLDKHGRSSARALLALTEARDLSFSLLRMLQIDISLPFKFVGLLVTYLIIMLQFEKVLQSNQA